MPTVQHGWNLTQTIDLRIGAIQYLRSVERRNCISTFLTMWWDYWRDTYGIPDPGNWDEVNNYRDYVEEYRRRVFRTIQWYALSGRAGHTSSAGRMRRIRQLRSALLTDISEYQRLGIVVSVHNAPPQFEPLFEDTIRGYSLLDLGVRERR